MSEKGTLLTAMAVDSAHAAIVTAPRDWSVEETDAWLYAILVGWHAALPEVAAKHGWSEQTQVLLTELNETVESLRGVSR